MTTFAADVNIEQLEYKPVHRNRSGGQVVYVSTRPGSTEYEDRLRFQMSESAHCGVQRAVWGLSTPLPGQDPDRRTLDLTIESPSLMGFLQGLDEKNIDVATDNSKDYFKKEHPRSVIETMYVPLVKAPNKEGHCATVRTKVKCGQKFPTNIWIVREEGDGDRQQINYDAGTLAHLTKNCKVLALVETSGLWFMNNRQFGMSLVATDLLVWPNARGGGVHAFNLGNNVKLNRWSGEAPEGEGEDYMFEGDADCMQ